MTNETKTTEKLGYLYVRYLGDSLLGKIKEETETYVILEDVKMIAIVPTPQGMQVMTLPFSPTSIVAKEIKLQKDLILYQEDGKPLHDNLERARIEQELNLAKPTQDNVKNASRLVMPSGRA